MFFFGLFYVKESSFRFVEIMLESLLLFFLFLKFLNIFIVGFWIGWRPPQLKLRSRLVDCLKILHRQRYIIVWLLYNYCNKLDKVNNQQEYGGDQLTPIFWPLRGCLRQRLITCCSFDVWMDNTLGKTLPPMDMVNKCGNMVVLIQTYSLYLAT